MGKTIWWNGFHTLKATEIEYKYPIVVTSGLRFSEDMTNMAVSNNFKKGTDLYMLADPEIAWPTHEDLFFGHRTPENFYFSPGKPVFYHIFLGHDAAPARRAIRMFISKTRDIKPADDALRRVIVIGNNDDPYYDDTPDEYPYTYADVCGRMMNDQAGLFRRLTKNDKGSQDRAFILPLRSFRYKCPVCGHRTLNYRYCCLLCVECGWEDDDPLKAKVREETKDYSDIKEYRRWYLKKKAENPDYTWWQG